MDIVFCDVIGPAGNIYIAGAFYSDVLEKIDTFHLVFIYLQTIWLIHVSRVGNPWCLEY